MRGRLVRMILVAVIAAAGCLAILEIRAGLRNSVRWAAMGTAKSIAAALITELRAQNEILRGILSPEKTDWTFLSDEEYDSVIAELAKHRSLDAPRGWVASEALLDPWGKRFLIKYRCVGGTPEVLVLSSGADRQLGTSDDIVTP